MKLLKIKRPRWTRSKTQIFAVALVVLGAMQANLEIFSVLFSQATVGYIGSGIGIVVFILRAYTTNSLADKCRDSRDRHYEDENRNSRTRDH